MTVLPELVQVQGLWPPTVDSTQPCVSIFKTKNLSFTQNTTRTQRGKVAENLIAQAYQRSGWKVLFQNYRIRGSELDLVVANENTKEGRIIEVKFRTSQNQNLADIEQLLNFKKLDALQTGALSMDQTLRLKGQNYSWSLDLVLVTSSFKADELRLLTWVNAVSLN